MANLTDMVASCLQEARESEHGRGAKIVAHDGVLRQTVIALREGARLAEHNSPPAASLQVFEGRIRIETGEQTQRELGPGELWVLTHERHGVLALEDTAFLLTTVTSVGDGSHGQ